MDPSGLAPSKKNARRLKAWIGFLDETGFSQRPPVRATWAPRGQTPLLRETFNWKRLSGIGLVLVSPRGRRLRWFLSFHNGSVRSDQIVRFLGSLRRHRRHRVILLWDGLPAHRSAAVKQAMRGYRSWLEVKRLPAYAPELNPVEPFWDYLDDTQLANTPAEDLLEIRQRVRRGLSQVRRKPTLGRGFLKYTGLF